MPKQHILDQLQITAWEMVPRKYNEINRTVAAWLGLPVKEAPRLKWVGAYERRAGADGIFLAMKKPVMLVKCGIARTEILETIYHEFLHYYLPDVDEEIIVGFEQAILCSP